MYTAPTLVRLAAVAAAALSIVACGGSGPTGAPEGTDVPQANVASHALPETEGNLRAQPGSVAVISTAAPAPSGGGGGDTPPSSPSSPPADPSSPPASPSAPPADPGAAPAPAPSPAPAAATTEYAPYFYAQGWDNTSYAFRSLADLHAKSGLSSVTLAFVVANGGCHATRDIQDHLADVKAFIAAGGHVKASFGGQSDTYLETACRDSASLANELTAFVDETGITDLDFDVEQPVAMNATTNTMRSKALASVQASRGVKIAFTVPSDPGSASGPGGMSPEGLAVVSSAVANGVKISHVNLMTMDFGTSYSAGKTMGSLAISAATGGAAQLRALLPSLDEAGSFAMIGVTPMIGQNDEPTEKFTLADAATLVAFAKSKHLGLVAFWAINRDQPCAGSDLSLCSAASPSAFAFHSVLKGVL